MKEKYTLWVKLPNGMLYRPSNTKSRTAWKVWNNQAQRFETREVKNESG